MHMFGVVVAAAGVAAAAACLKTAEGSAFESGLLLRSHGGHGTVS